MIPTQFRRTRIAFALALSAAFAATGSACVVATNNPTPNRDPYALCNTGDTCGGGTACYGANTTVDPGGTAAAFCTAGCTAGSSCPEDLDGYATVCVETASSGECYRVCGAGNTCPSGFTCAGPVGMTPYCVPNSVSTHCGALGEACCATGAPCVDATAACGSDGVCGVAPYAGCAGTSLGQACASGTNSNGQLVQTSCQQPMISNPGANGWCTARCTGSATECPLSPIDGRSYGCFILKNVSVGQCYVDCTGGLACPSGTLCADTVLTDNSHAQVCMPEPAR